jgi:hypothetical protein
MLDELTPMRQAGRRIGGVGTPQRLATLPAQGGKANPAPDRAARELARRKDILGTAAQPAERVVGIGIDEDDKHRGMGRDRLDLVGDEGRAGPIENDCVVGQTAGQKGARRGKGGSSIDRARRLEKEGGCRVGQVADDEKAKQRVHRGVAPGGLLAGGENRAAGRLLGAPG